MAEKDTGIIDGMTESLLDLGIAVVAERKVDCLVSARMAVTGIERSEPRAVPVEIRELDCGMRKPQTMDVGRAQVTAYKSVASLSLMIIIKVSRSLMVGLNPGSSA